MFNGLRSRFFVSILSSFTLDSGTRSTRMLAMSLGSVPYLWLLLPLLYMVMAYMAYFLSTDCGASSFSVFLIMLPMLLGSVLMFSIPCLWIWWIQLCVPVVPVSSIRIWHLDVPRHVYVLSCLEYYLEIENGSWLSSSWSEVLHFTKYVVSIPDWCYPSKDESLLEFFQAGQ